MRTLLFAALAAASLSITPALAAPPAQDAAKATATTAPPTHEQCRAVMGRKMDPRRPHDHGADKTGAATWPRGKPLSKGEMDRMHARCAEMMAKGPPAKK